MNGCDDRTVFFDIIIEDEKGTLPAKSKRMREAKPPPILFSELWKKRLFFPTLGASNSDAQS